MALRFSCFPHIITAVLQADWTIPSMRPSAEWPHQGRIQMENFDLRYREQLPLVLKGINCAFEVREKVSVAWQLIDC